jgi:hypothetical protein
MVALFLSTMPEERSADSGTAPAELKLTPVKVSLPLCLKHGTEEKFTAFIDCDVCPKCFIDCYRPDHCRQFFAYDMDPDDSSRPRWWQRGFVCAFGRLMFHLEHDSNKDTFFVTHWSREDDDGPSVKLAPNVKYLLHIGMSRRGMHYAVLVFILASRTVIVYEGIGYKLDTWIPEVELVLKKFGFMRDKVQISEVRTEHSFDCNWTLERGSTIVEQTGDHNCGPIACCTLWYLLTLGDKHFGKWDGMKISSKYRDDAELRRDMVERYLEMQEKAEIYCPRKSKWVMLNLDETSPEYEAAKSIIGNANVAPPATASLPVSCTVELLGNTSPSGSTERPGSYTNGQSVTICDGPPPPPKSTTKMAPPPPPPREKEAPSVQDLAATASNKSKSSQESPLLNPPANQNILKVKSGQQPQFPNRAAPKQIEDSVLLHSQKVQQKVTDTVDLLSQHDESKIISQLSSLQPPRLPDAKLSSKGLVDGEEVEWTEDEHGKERKATKTEDEQRKATEAEDEQRKARESEAERKALAAQTKRKAKEEEKQRNVEVAKTRRKATAEREEQGRKRKAEEESKEKAELAENKFNKRETNAKEAKQRKLEEERKKKAEKDAMLSRKGLVDDEEVEWTEKEHDKEDKQRRAKEAVAKKRKAGEEKKRKAMEDETKRKVREEEEERSALAAQTERKAKEEEKQRNVEVAKTRRNAKVAEKKRNLEEEEERKRKAEEVLPSKGLLNGDEVKEEKKRKATAEREEKGRKRKAEEERKEKAELAENKFNKRETNAMEAKKRKLEEERKKKAEKDAMLSRKGLVDDEEVEWTEKEHDKEDKQRRAKEAVAKKRKAGEEKKRKAMEDETKRKVREEEEERSALAAQTERKAKEEEKQRNVEVAKTRRNAKVAEKKRNLEEEEERKRKAEEVLPSKGLLNGDEVKEEKKRKATAEREEKGRKRKAEEERKEKAELAENKFNKRETNAMEAKKRKLEEERKKKAEKDAMLSRKGLVDDEEVEWTEKEHDKEDKQRRAKETVAKKRKAGEEKKRKAMEDETRRKVREEEDEKKKKAMKEREEEERKRNEKEEGKRKAEEESKRKKEKMEAEEEKKRKAKEKEERDKVLLRLMALGYIRDSYNEYKKTREVIMDSCEHVLMVPHIDMKNCCKACYFLWMGQCCRLCLPDTEEKRLKWAEFFSQNPETLKDKYKPGLSTLRYWNDLLGKAEKDDPPHYSTWGHWGPDVIKSFMTFVMHEFHPGDVQVEYWDDDTAGYGDWECWRLFEWTRYLLVIVKRNDNHSLYVIDVDHGKCSIVDPAIQAKRSSHVQVIMKILSKHYLIPGTNVGQPRLVMMDDPITEEETNKPPFPRMSPTSVVSLRESKYRIPRRIVVPFQVTLNEEKYQPIFCAGNCWMSGPTTIVNFVATLFRLELTHDIAFHREQTRVALIKNQWRGGLLDSTGKLFDKWVGPMTLPSLLNGLCVQRHCDDILEYCTGTLLKTFLDGKTLQQLQPKDAQTARRIQYESKDFAADWEKKTRSSGSEWNAITGELVHAWRSEMERRKDLWETKQLNK